MSIDAMKTALEALEIVTRHFTRTPSTLKDSEARSTAHAAITALRLAIEQAEKQKPMHPELRKMWEDYFDKCFRDAPPQRQPLTEEEIRAAYGNDLNYRDGDYVRFARAIERAHGIGRNNA